MYVCMHVCMYVCTCMYVCLYACSYAWVLYIYAYTYALVFACMSTISGLFLLGPFGARTLNGAAAHLSLNVSKLIPEI